MSAHNTTLYRTGKYFISASVLIFSCSTNAAYYYEDYAALRNSFEDERQLVNTRIDQSNRRYVHSLNNYQACASDRWRVAFTTVIPEIDQRRLELDNYKRSALKESSKLNSEWLTTAKEHDISRIGPTEDISDFYFWYQNHIGIAKQGPIHELEVYTVGLSKLSDTYEKMAQACAGSSDAASSYSIVESGIRGLLDEVFSLIGRK